MAKGSTGRLWKSAAVLLCALAGATAATAQSHPHGAHANARVAAADLGTSAAVDARGVLWAVHKDSDGQGKPVVALRSSPDMGRSWTQPRVVVQDSVTARGEERPQIAFAPNGEMFILYTSPLPGSRNPHIGSIRLVRSLDGGQSFSEPKTVHAHRDATVHAFGTMLFDREGRLFVAWIDGRDAAAAKAGQQAYAGSAIYYAVSSDGGASFAGDFKIADHSCECCRIGLALNSQGRPVAMWRHVFEGSIRDHAIAELGVEGKAVQAQRASFDDWRIEACPHHGPSLAFAQNGTRHQVWFSGRQGQGSGALYAMTTPEGKAGQPQVLGSAQASHPDVAVLGSHVAVVWKQFNGQASVIMARLSQDGGRRWEEREVASTLRDSDRPRLVNIGATIHLLWHTRNEGLRLVPLKWEKS